MEELIKALSRCRPHQRQSPRSVPTLAESRSVEAPAPIESRVEAESPDVLDPAALQRLRVTLGKQADRMLPDLIEGFYRDADRLLDQARQASDQRNADDLRRASHSLKSTSATFGVMALSATARELERLAREGRFEGAAGLIARAESELATARAALEMVQDEL
jgi:HPt (histidine-containing phosphotransfer) domain-containing protein